MTFPTRVRAARGVPAGEQAKNEALLSERLAAGCEKCGKKGADLVFHHVAPEERKKAGKSMRSKARTQYAGGFAKELSETIVLCPTCHRLLHKALRAASKARKD